MGRKLTDLSYDDWIEHVFGHAVPFYEHAWYNQPDADRWEPPAARAVDYLTRLFANPEPLAEQFADDQIGQGLWYLIENGAGAYCRFLIDGSVAIPARVTCIRAMYSLFARLFEARCRPRRAHLDEPGGNRLSTTCYLWWDVIPLAASGKPRQPDPIHDACLAVMEKTLWLRNPACQESALHGLGHWADAYPEFAATAIDAYLARNPALPPELVRYAQAARTGCIQ